MGEIATTTTRQSNGRSSYTRYHNFVGDQHPGGSLMVGAPTYDVRKIGAGITNPSIRSSIGSITDYSKLKIGMAACRSGALGGARGTGQICGQDHVHRQLHHQMLCARARDHSWRVARSLCGLGQGGGEHWPGQGHGSIQHSRHAVAHRRLLRQAWWWMVMTACTVSSM